MKQYSLLICIIISFILASSELRTFATNPPEETEAIILNEETDDDPHEDNLRLDVFYIPSAHQIQINTYSPQSQWIWVTIIDSQTNSIYSTDVLDTNNNGNTYYINAPAIPGDYCVVFTSLTDQTYGYFHVYSN